MPAFTGHTTGQADFPHPALGQDFTLSRATPSAASEHLLELIGFPISRSFTTYCVCLELRSLPSTGVTRLPRYYEPLRHPRAPSLSLTGFRLVIADHALGLPVFRALSLCTCRRHYPGAASERIASLISSRHISLPRKGCRVDLRIVLFAACSAFTRVAACTLALSPIRDTLIEGFSHFVTSMTAPIASGWSGCRVGLAPTGKRRLSTAHTHTGHRRPKSATGTPAGLRNFGVIPGVMNWAVLCDFAFGSTHMPSVVANGGSAGGSHEYQANPGST